MNNFDDNMDMPIDQDMKYSADQLLENAAQHSISIEGDYELEIFLSTDGKHTVNGRAKTTEGKKKMYTACISLYDRILERYGTKQGQAVKEYKSPPITQKAVVSQSSVPSADENTGSRVCPKHNKAMTLGQWGWYCKTKDDSAPKGWCTYKIK